MTKKQKKMLLRILLSFVFFLLALLLPLPEIWKTVALLVPYAIIGWDILWRAIRNIFHGHIFDENFLMSIATVGALALGDYPEAVAVMLFYQVGEFFQSYAVGKSRKSIASLMDIRPDYAHVKKDGAFITVDPEEVAVGDIILVKPGERVPLDGVVTEGNSAVNTAALTGESIPRDVAAGNDVLSGSVNLHGLLYIKVSKIFGESTVAKILDLVENASTKKAKTENFITVFARYYTPFVVFFALFLAILPPLFFGGIWSDWIHRALIFLVISCPCALVISVPLSFFGGIGAASRNGILVKGGNYLEALAKSETVIFDKTGTLTKGSFVVTKVNPLGISSDELLEIATLGESYSTHPISLSLQKSYGKNIEKERVTNVQEIPGHGVSCSIDGKEVWIGNEKLMKQENITVVKVDAIGTVIHVAKGKKYLGYILIADEIKEDAVKTIALLKEHGIKETVMLTGDRKAVGESVGSHLGIDTVKTELLPHDKVRAVEDVLAKKSKHGKVVFVGDGINDAPVLAVADIGIAMGGVGSDAAIEAADIVLMDDQPSKIGKAIQISQKTLTIVKQNIIFALSIKLIFLVLGAFGLASMWEAVFADVGVSVLAISNAMRALKS